MIIEIGVLVVSLGDRVSAIRITGLFAVLSQSPIEIPIQKATFCIVFAFLATTSFVFFGRHSAARSSKNGLPSWAPKSHRA